MVKFNTDPLWVRLLLALSGTAYSVLLMQTASKLSFTVTGILCLFLLLILCLKTAFLQKIFAEHSWVECLVAGALTLSALYTAKSTFFSTCYSWMRKLLIFLGMPHIDILLRLAPWGMALLALPMAFGYFLWFVGFFAEQGKRFWRDVDFTEKLFLLGAGILFSILIVFTFFCTQAFYGAHVNGSWFNFDLIYSADSGYLVHQDVFRNVGAEQNDLRQPLFGVFAMPFAQGAFLLSKVLFFLPNAYVTVLQIMEVLLFLVAAILIARMMKLRGASKALFLVLLSVSFPVLIFSLTAEQYLFAVFYLVWMIYLCDEPLGGSVGYIAATGSMLTTGIFFPLITWHKKFGTFVKRTLLLCGAFFAVMILSGRLTTFLDIPTYIGEYGYYTGADVALKQKLMQYVNFAGSLLVAPASRVDFETYRHVSWQMVPVTAWRPLGFAVFLAAAGGVFVGRKERFSQVCGVWIAFSLLLLGLIGWGTIDNGLMLYSLYFGWAFVAMIFQLLDRLPCRWQGVRTAMLLALILTVGIQNVTVLRSILVFATQYFPALR